MLIPRLVFGCARLTGGFSSSEARHVIELALKAGFRHFDTAPSYGIGTAEKIIGEFLRPKDGVEVTAKVGSTRPRFPVAKTAARRALRLLGHRSKLITLYEPSMPGFAHGPDGCFDKHYMERSLALTLANLRRGSVTHLLLHESYRAPPPPELIAFLDELIATGITEHVGFANSAVYDTALYNSCPRHWTVQAAIHPDMLHRPTQVADSTILHSLFKTHLWLSRIDDAYCFATINTLEKFAKLAPRHILNVLLPYYLVLNNLPDVKLIYATSEVTRLNDIITSAVVIDEAVGGDAMASAFFDAYYSYQ